MAMNATHSAQTDTKNKIKLESSIIYAEWKSPAAVGGYTAELEVVTSMVGEGATIEIKGKSSKGKAPDGIKGTVHGNYFAGSLPIPEKVDPSAEIWFEAKLPKHGLKMESLPIPARPPIYATSLKWDKQEVHRGDIVKMQGKFEGCVPNSEAQVIVYEYNLDGHHDRITTIPTRLKNMDLEVQWEFQYQYIIDDILLQSEAQQRHKNYLHPKYYFVVSLDGVQIGKNQESGLLKYVEWIEITLLDQARNAIANENCTILCADGTTLTKTTDSQGKVRLDSLPPGRTGIHTASNYTFKIEISEME
jgi:hypothetical protein